MALPSHPPCLPSPSEEQSLPPGSTEHCQVWNSQCFPQAAHGEDSCPSQLKLGSLPLLLPQPSEVWSQRQPPESSLLEILTNQSPILVKSPSLCVCVVSTSEGDWLTFQPACYLPPFTWWFHPVLRRFSHDYAKD